jgi:hypothetical protein
LENAKKMRWLCRDNAAAQPVYAKFNQPLVSFTRTTTIEGAALIVGSRAWAGLTRTIRAQTLSLRERAALCWSLKVQ